MRFTYFEFVSVVFVTQHAKRMRPICCRLWPVRLYHVFTHYLINAKIFGREVIEHKMCFDFLYNVMFETFIILRRIQLEIFINVHRSSCEVPVILVRC
jgi:hypothetical protein